MPSISEFLLSGRYSGTPATCTAVQDLSVLTTLVKWVGKHFYCHLSLLSNTEFKLDVEVLQLGLSCAFFKVLGHLFVCLRRVL